MTSIKNSAFRGVVWTGFYYTMDRVGSFLSTLVLAAILAPSDFGVIGAAYIAVGAMGRIANSGVSAYLIYEPKTDEEIEKTAFQLALLIGVVGYAVIFLLSNQVGAFFNDQRVADVLKLLGLLLPLESAKSIPSAILERRLAFRERLVPDFIGLTIKVAVSIALALAGLGVWSIVAGVLVSESLITALLYVRTKWLPVKVNKISWDKVREIVSYAKNMQFAGIVGFFVTNMDYSIIGRFLGTFYLGIYTFAFNIANLPALLVTQAFSRVLFPTYSRLQRREEIGKAFVKTIKYTGLLAFPICVGMYFTVPVFLKFAYGDKWVQAIPVLKILVIQGLLRAMSSGTGEVFKAIGRPDILTKLAFAMMVVSLPILLIAVKFGIVFVGISMAAIAALFSFVRIRIVLRATRTSWSALLSAVKLSMFSAALMGALIQVIMSSRLWSSNELLALLASIFLGAVFYTGLMGLLERESLAEINLQIQQSFLRIRERKASYVKT